MKGAGRRPGAVTRPQSFGRAARRRGRAERCSECSRSAACARAQGGRARRFGLWCLRTSCRPAPPPTARECNGGAEGIRTAPSGVFRSSFDRRARTYETDRNIDCGSGSHSEDPSPSHAGAWAPPSPARGEGPYGGSLDQPLSPCGRGRGPAKREGEGSKEQLPEGSA